MFKELDIGVLPIGNVDGVQFSVLSPEEIEKRSVAEIITQETYDGDMPKVGGLFDRRMGVLDAGHHCLSCNEQNNLCPGHFGHIKLASPVFYIQFFNIVLKVLQMTCVRCSKILLDLTDDSIKNQLLKRNNNQRFNYVLSQCSKIGRCGDKNKNGCGAKKPNIKKEPNSTSICNIRLEWKMGTDSHVMNWGALEVLKVLKHISVEECELIGFNRFWCRPDWLICQVLPVPPPAVRPSVRNDSNTRMEDDLTHKLCDIVKTNRSLKQKIDANAPKNIIDDWINLLQYHVATLVDNNIKGISQAQQRSGRALKSIKDRLKAKEGRVRGNLMGKRVDFSARSVITPDSNIEIDELGVPEKIAKNVTYPDIVTELNRNFLTQLIRNGPDKYPGAKSYRKASDKEVRSLKYGNREEIFLENGDIVNRHLLDGDIVLFNRQPSLHRMSMMAHRVRVMKYNTFRLNTSTCTPYNADFDSSSVKNRRH